MAIDIRPGSPYTGQLVCTCEDGGGFQGMAPNCCPVAPPPPPPPAAETGAGNGGGGGSASTVAGPSPASGGSGADDGGDDGDTTVLVTESEEPNWFDGEWISGVKNKWLAVGGGGLVSSLSCICLLFLLLIIR